MPAQFRHRPSEERSASLPGARSHPGAGRDAVAPGGDVTEDYGVRELSPAFDGPVTHEASRPVEADEPAGATHARERADRTPRAADTGPSPHSEHTEQPGRAAPPRGTAESASGACDVVTVPARQGFEVVDLLRLRASGGIGPVLHDDACRTLGFVVPPGTAAGWDVPGSACTRAHGRGPRSGARAARTLAPYGAREAVAEDAAPPVPGAGWLVPPAEAYRDATDPAVLRAALGEAARVIEVIDRSH